MHEFVQFLVLQENEYCSIPDGLSLVPVVVGYDVKIFRFNFKKDRFYYLSACDGTSDEFYKIKDDDLVYSQKQEIFEHKIVFLVDEDALIKIDRSDFVYALYRAFFVVHMCSITENEYMVKGNITEKIVEWLQDYENVSSLYYQNDVGYAYSSSWGVEFKYLNDLDVTSLYIFSTYTKRDRIIKHLSMHYNIIEVW